jgi:hypothetical protein
MQDRLTVIPSPPREVEDIMSLNPTDKSWVQREIEMGFQKHRSERGKVAGFIKDWGEVGAVVAILLFGVTQWGDYKEFRVHTGDRLDSGN